VADAPSTDIGAPTCPIGPPRSGAPTREARRALPTGPGPSSSRAGWNEPTWPRLPRPTSEHPPAPSNLRGQAPPRAKRAGRSRRARDRRAAEPAGTSARGRRSDDRHGSTHLPHRTSAVRRPHARSAPRAPDGPGRHRRAARPAGEPTCPTIRRDRHRSQVRTRGVLAVRRAERRQLCGQRVADDPQPPPVQALRELNPFPKVQSRWLLHGGRLSGRSACWAPDDGHYDPSRTQHVTRTLNALQGLWTTTRSLPVARAASGGGAGAHCQAGPESRTSAVLAPVQTSVPHRCTEAPFPPKSR
jgi:hypothetical protein